MSTVDEFNTGRVKFTKLQRKTAALTALAITNHLKDEFSLTLTLDNGTEFTKHEYVQQKAKLKTY